MTTIQSDELSRLKSLFGEASNNRSFDTYTMNAIPSGDSSNEAWTKVASYMKELAGKYNHDVNRFSINPNTGEVTGTTS